MCVCISGTKIAETEEWDVVSLACSFLCRGVESSVWCSDLKRPGLDRNVFFLCCLSHRPKSKDKRMERQCSNADMKSPHPPSSSPQPHRAALTTPVVKLDVVALVTGEFISVFLTASLTRSQENNTSFCVSVAGYIQTRMSLLSIHTWLRLQTK